LEVRLQNEIGAERGEHKKKRRIKPPAKVDLRTNFSNLMSIERGKVGMGGRDNIVTGRKGGVGRGLWQRKEGGRWQPKGESRDDFERSCAK
jgi:hypothetical protein